MRQKVPGWQGLLPPRALITEHHSKPEFLFGVRPSKQSVPINYEQRLD